MQGNIVILSQKIDVFLANNVDCDEMTHNAAFYLNLHCLSICHFMGYQSANNDHVNLKRLKHFKKGEV